MPTDSTSLGNLQRALPESVTNRTFRGLFWTFLGTGGQAVVQLVALIVLARLVSPGEFGIVAAALVVVGFSTVFSQLGIGPAVVQRPDLEPAHLRTGFTISALLGMMLGGSIWLLAPLVAEFFQREELTDVLRVMSVVFPLQGLAVVAESLLQRSLRFRLLAVIDLTAVAAGYGAVGVPLALAGLGVWALVGAHLAQHALKAILYLLASPHAKLPLIQRRALRELMLFGGGFTIARLSNYLASQGDNVVIGRWLGPVALGVYGRAYQLMLAPASIVGQVLDRVLFPAMALVQERKDKLASAYRRGVAVIGLVALPGTAALIALAPEVVYVLLGPSWEEAIVPLQVLAAGMLFRTSYKMSDSLARATGAVYRRAWRQTAYAVLVFLGALVGQVWGLPGVAAGVVVAVGVNFLLMAQLSLALTGLSWRSFAVAHLPGLALAVVLGIESAVLAGALRALGAAPIIILTACAALLLPTVYLIYRLPRVFLGEDGLWVCSRVGAFRVSDELLLKKGMS